MDAAGAFAAIAWSLAAASGLIIGAALGIFANLPKRAVAGVLAFGSGILISAIAFDLMGDAFGRGGFVPAAAGFLIGAAVYTAASLVINRWQTSGRTGSRSSSKKDKNALAIVAGTFIDAIPESIIIGMSVVGGSAVVIPFVVAVFVSNIPEALSSSAEMKSAGHGPGRAFAFWGGIALASGLFALIGYALTGLPPEWFAVIQAFGGGALLALIADNMIPEAFADTHDWTGFIAAFGFLAGFALSHGFG